MPPYPKDADGNPLCRWCNGPLSGRRTSWCSQKCVDEYELRYDSKRQRREIRKRDKGVCAICTLDTEGFKVEFKRLYFDAIEEGQRYVHVEALLRIPTCVAFLEQHRMTGKDVRFKRHGMMDFWEMDHTIPVIEGGGGVDLSGLRTLCRPCHRDVTKALAARRAEQRRKPS